MLRAFDIRAGRLKKTDVDSTLLDVATLSRATWLDLNDGDEDETAAVESILATDVPLTDDIEELEASSRYFVDELGIHVNTLYLSQSEGRYQTSSVAFKLQEQRLITVRDNHLPVFRLMRLRARAGQVALGSPAEVMMHLFEYKVEQLADTIEDLYEDLEKISHTVLEDEDAEMEHAIDELAVLEDTNGKVRLCLLDTQRSMSFLLRHLRADQTIREQCQEILRDAESLMQHTTFVFEKVNFLMDAAQGFINIEQNKIIKTFSIVSLIFIPPTLIASAYGMNFQYMPELAFRYGYPVALGLMFMAGLLPLWYFKRKGWL